MLSKEELRLLRWLSKQSEKVTMAEMEDIQAPGFTRDRVESMRTADLINRGTDLHLNEIVGIYSISDKGRAELRAEKGGSFKEFRAWATLGIAILSLVLSVIALIK